MKQIALLLPVDHVYGQPVILDSPASKTICSNDFVLEIGSVIVKLLHNELSAINTSLSLIQIGMTMQLFISTFCKA